ASVFTPAKSISSETPSQVVPSFDHRVTQCRSVVNVSAGRLRNDLQSHRRRTSVPSSIVSSHFSSDTCGVGPAERTEKPAVRYCPGGSLPFAVSRRPEKPGETRAIFQCLGADLLGVLLVENRVELKPGHVRLSDVSLVATRAFGGRRFAGPLVIGQW